MALKVLFRKLTTLVLACQHHPRQTLLGYGFGQCNGSTHLSLIGGAQPLPRFRFFPSFPCSRLVFYSPVTSFLACASTFPFSIDCLYPFFPIPHPLCLTRALTTSPSRLASFLWPGLYRSPATRLKHQESKCRRPMSQPRHLTVTTSCSGKSRRIVKRLALVIPWTVSGSPVGSEIVGTTRNGEAEESSIHLDFSSRFLLVRPWFFIAAEFDRSACISPFASSENL